MATNNLKQTLDDFELQQVLFTSNRGEGLNFAIENIITDFEIFEHIDKPYLSMQMSILDTNNFVQSVDLQGGETIEITIQSTETRDNVDPITKKFIIDKVLKSQKPDDKTEVYYLHCFEDIVLTSSLININRYYNDTPTKIVDQILKEYLGKNVIRSLDEYQTNMQLVIPNMHPLEAAAWVKKRITSVDGFPYYLYSNLNTNDLYLIDLEQLLRREPINKKAPMTWIQSMGQQYQTDDVMPILSYTHENVDDILTLIRSGVVGSDYNFLDTMTGKNTLCKFDVVDDVFKSLEDNTIFKKQKRYNYPTDQKVMGQNFSSYSSEIITKITSNGSYNNKNHRVRAADEEFDPIAYKKRISGHALRNFMTKAPITIQVNGRPFLAGTGDYTIGNVVRLLFLDSQRRSSDDINPDYKKSGDYLMCAAKHSFSVRNPNRVNTSLVCARLAMYSDNLSVGDFINA